jgi:hypothetical protein
LEITLNLYQATELARLESHVDAVTGEIDLAAFESSQIALIEKQRSVVAYIKNVMATSDMIDQAIKDLTEKKRLHASRADRLKEYLKGSMVASNTLKIEALDGTFSATLSLGRDESVLLDDGFKFPPELCNDPKPPEPSKTKIKDAIKRGEPVAGAQIVRKNRITIK